MIVGGFFIFNDYEGPGGQGGRDELNFVSSFE